MFDGYFLAATSAARRWSDIATQVLTCVTRREAAMHVQASEPQAFIGSAVVDLPVPWRKSQSLLPKS